MTAPIVGYPVLEKKSFVMTTATTTAEARGQNCLSGFGRKRKISDAALHTLGNGVTVAQQTLDLLV